MKERPILFSAPMIRALLANRKTQTRRSAGAQLVRIGTHLFDPRTPHHVPIMLGRSRFGKAGDRLWVRETWAPQPAREESFALPEYEGGGGDRTSICYRADERVDRDGMGLTFGVKRWRPSIFMPRWASRLLLEVVDVRVERLHAITDEDARAEGVTLGELMPARINGERGRVVLSGTSRSRSRGSDPSPTTCAPCCAISGWWARRRTTTTPATRGTSGFPATPRVAWTASARRPR